MIPARVVWLGIAFLVLGLVLLVFGVTSTESVGEQLRRVFSGRLSDQTAWYMIGGAIVAIVGALLTYTGSRHHIA